MKKTPQNAAGSNPQNQAPAIPLGPQLLRIIERANGWVSAEMSAWKAALAVARNPDKPRRALLQRLYETAAADPHLSAALEKRSMRVAGQRIRVVDASNKEDEVLAALFAQPWFLSFIEACLSCIAAGPCVITFRPPSARGMAPIPQMLPRAHYVPEQLAVIPDLSAEDDIVRLDEPFHAPWVIHVGDARDMGILWKAVPIIIFKNAANAAWSEYADLFGQPIRKATVPPSMSDAQLRQIDEQLANMGRSAYIRLPSGVEFDLTSASGRSGIEVFKDRLEFCNNELSKLCEGQTMTSDSGSSLSQAEVHQGTADLYTQRDRVWLQNVVNHQLMPLLAHHGFQTAGKVLVWADEKEIDFDRQLQADKWLLENFEIDHSHFAAKYGVPIKGPKVKTQPSPAPAPKARGHGRLPILAGVYGSVCPGCAGGGPRAESPDLSALRDILERLARQLHEGGIPEGEVPLELLAGTGSLYETALGEGFGALAPAWDSPDQAALEFLRADAWQFAGARSETEMALIRELLVDAGGRRRSWSDFRQEVLARNADYFEPWLRTEFAHAQVSSVAASQWLQVTADAETWPSLRYETVGDERVRETHKALDGVTRPVDDHFWDESYPPNGWRCRCDVAQVDEDAALTPPADAEAASTKAVTDPRFRTNVGKTLAAFPSQHPYRDAGRQALSFGDLGLPESSRLPKARVPKASAKDVADWFARLPDAGNAGRQATVAGRGMALEKPMLDALEAAGKSHAASPLVAGTDPAETWVRRSDASVLLKLVWSTTDGLVTAMAVTTREGMRLVDLSLADPKVADGLRNGTLIPSTR